MKKEMLQLNPQKYKETSKSNWMPIKQTTGKKRTNF